MITTRKKNFKGFTMVEVLLYLSIISIILLSVSYFFSIMMEARVKNQTISEVDQAGIQAMQLIQQSIRNAESINSPSSGASAESCSLAMEEAGIDPTVFGLAGSALTIQEGSSPPVNLNSARLEISNLAFSNLGRNGTKGIIRIQFTVSHKNPTGRNEYNYSKNFIGSVALR